jgi:hypothetical protein
MLFIIIGIVVVIALLVPILLPMDGKYTHKKCKFCRRSIKVESTRCRYCKKVLIDFPDDPGSKKPLEEKDDT